MLNSHSYIQSVRQRISWLGLIIGLIFGLFALRLFFIQVVQFEHYEAIAQQNQVTKRTIFPERGTIFARDGGDVVPLVMNETVYTVFADPHEVKDAEKVKNVMYKVAGGELIEDSLPNLNDKTKRYLVLARQISRTQAQMLQKEELAGVGVQPSSKRVYPEGQLASQLLGFVNADGKGNYGVEGAMNSRLAGKTGLLQAVTDVRRIPLTIGSGNTEVPAVNGDNVVLSIDRNVQFELENILKSNFEKSKPENASAVVMDPNTGQVVAMANYPTYDPNAYTKVTDYSLFQNRVTDNAYEPGSVMKTLTVAAGLDSKAITPTSTSPNPNGCTKVEDAVICNVLRGVTTTPTTQQLLTYSLNTGAVDVARKMGGGSINRSSRDKLYDYYANRFRLGKVTGLEQAGEVGGSVISPEEQEGNTVRYANMTFGQGMSVTMLQVTAAFASTVNGGTYYQPTLVYGTKQTDGTVKEQAPTVVQQGVISPEHSAEMRDLVWRSRYDNNGKTVDPAGYHVGGKSGTAETIDPKTNRYTADRTIGSYLGYVSSSTGMPQYVIMVRMDFAEGGTYAGSAAANTMFDEMARWLITYKGIAPN